MLITVKEAQRATKDHYGVSPSFTESAPKILKGEKFLQISNGTIGPGARNTNINKNDAIKMLKKMLAELEGKPVRRSSKEKEELKAQEVIDNTPF